MAQSEVTTCLTRPAEGFYTTQVQTPRAWPVRTFLPYGYERNYPYPLLVFLHGNGGCEEQILRLAPRLSRRNYICIGLRGPLPGRL
jgi:phospholipase/carboxylesterase